MRTIGAALAELLGVLAAGFLGFFVMLAYAAGALLLLACGFACAGFLLVALFSMVVWLCNHNAHAFRVMVGYFTYAGGTFAVIAALSYYHGKFTDSVRARREQRTALRQIRQFRAMGDATFDIRATETRRRSADSLAVVPHRIDGSHH